jgi:hypothetical protein
MGTWQDVVFTVGIALFSVALLPSLRSRHKPAASTSISHAIILVVFIIADISLGLWYTAAASAVSCALWTTLAIQKLRE